MKRLVACADGTWSRAEQEGAGDRKSTNVLKLLRAVRPAAGDPGYAPENVPREG